MSAQQWAELGETIKFSSEYIPLCSANDDSFIGFYLSTCVKAVKLFMVAEEVVRKPVDVPDTLDPLKNTTFFCHAGCLVLLLYVCL
ncbi:hypothetical protein GGR92_001323 [Spirosoma lacussanchae]